MAEFNVYDMIFKLEKLRDFHLNFEKDEEKPEEEKPKSKKNRKKKEPEKMDEISEKPGEEDEDEGEEEQHPQEEEQSSAEASNQKEPSESQDSTTADTESQQLEPEPVHPDPSTNQPPAEPAPPTQTPPPGQPVPSAPTTPTTPPTTFDPSRLSVPKPGQETPDERQQRLLDAQLEQQRAERYFIEEEKEASIENKYFVGLLPGLTQTHISFLPLSDTLDKLSEKKKFQAHFDLIVQGFLSSGNIRSKDASVPLTKLLKPSGLLYQENCQ